VNFSRVRIKDAEQKKNQSIETAENERERKICVYVKKWYKRDDIVSPAMRLENPSFCGRRKIFDIIRNSYAMIVSCFHNPCGYGRNL
jgi:hypothetical protein